MFFFSFFLSYLFQWNMESCPLLWNSTSEEESVNGNHWKGWGEMFAINRNYSSHQFIIIMKEKKIHCEKIDATKHHCLRIKQCMLFPVLRVILIFFFFFLQNEKNKKRKLSDTLSEITEMKVKYLRYNFGYKLF